MKPLNSRLVYLSVTHSYLVSDITQYHQVPDEYFTSAVVLSLILAALFGLVYLLIIPQYVQKTQLLSLLLYFSSLRSPPLIDFSCSDLLTF